MNLVVQLSFAIACAGVLLVPITIAGTSHWRPGAAAALDLWLAAGLLRLSADLSFQSIGAAALILAIRKVSARALHVT